VQRTQGFTLIELMIVVAIIAIIASIAIPNLLAARLAANETAAVATLRNISTCQAQFQASAKADVDNDGAGEFGLFREMSGAAPVRTSADGSYSGGSLLNPTVLSGAFRALNGDGEVTKSGFHFKVYLPAANGFALSDLSTTAIETSGPSDINADMAETTWCAYAWPAQGDSTGHYTFFVNQTGDITKSTQGASQRSGPNGIEADEAGFAFTSGGSARSITGTVAQGVTGRDGNLWLQIN
jgi:prepilin-type N-terminal cleavage/methylation domain-containing protein